MKRNKKKKEIKKTWQLRLQLFLKENGTAIIVLLLFVIPITGLIIYSNTLRDNRLAEYQCETKCLNVSATANEMISHGMDGSHITYPIYSIEFEYRIGTRIIKNKNVVKNNDENKELIKSAVSNRINELIIKYDCAIHQNSLISIKDY